MKDKNHFLCNYSAYLFNKLGGWGGGGVAGYLLICRTYLVRFILFVLLYTCKPLHDKTNKMAVRPAKTQISLGSAQSDQSLRCALSGWLRTQAFFMRTAKTLIG